MSYTIQRESFSKTLSEIEPLYIRHYEEMKAKLDKEGVHLSAYNPRRQSYLDAEKLGCLITFIVRCEGKAVGHSNVHLMNDLHNNELNAHEDTIYILPEHRNGIGRKLIKFIINELRQLGIRRFYASPVTDPRAGKLFERIGFKNSAQQMIYHF